MVGLPFDAFEIEKDAQFLRARRAHIMQRMHALPCEYLTGLDIAVQE
jgi:Nitrogen fixation protein NifW